MASRLEARALLPADELESASEPLEASAHGGKGSRVFVAGVALAVVAALLVVYSCVPGGARVGGRVESRTALAAGMLEEVDDLVPQVSDTVGSGVGAGVSNDLHELLTLGTNQTGKQAQVYKTARIAVVGAGPAGIHMASRLAKLGYKHVTVLEKTGRVGGKSFTLYRDLEGNPCEQQRDESTGKVDTASCIRHDMGTVYLPFWYYHVRGLMKEYGLTPGKHIDLRNYFGISEGVPSGPMERVTADEIARLIRTGKIRRPAVVPWRSSTGLEVLKVLVDAVLEFQTLSDAILGKVAYAMPARLSREKLTMIDMPFLEWCEAHGLSALLLLFRTLITFSGYGYFDTLPAYYALVFLRPLSLRRFVRLSFRTMAETVLGTVSEPLKPLVVHVADFFLGEHAPLIAILPEGWQQIWKRMHEKDAIDVRFNVEITEIDRQLHDMAAPVKITYSQSGGARQTEDFDVLIYTAPHALARSFVKDVVTKEQGIFERLRAYVLLATLYKGAPVPGYSTPGAKRYDSLLDARALADSSTDGQLYGDAEAEWSFSQADGVPKQTRVAYQFYEDPCAVDAQLCDFAKFPRASSPHFDPVSSQATRLVDSLAQLQALSVDVEEQCPWPYFWHFAPADIREGLPWDLLELQGQRKTFWLGASAHFESVHDVVNYNLMILNHHFGGHFEGDGEQLLQNRM